MKNFLILALAAAAIMFACISLSSCGVFKDYQKDKNKTRVDSSSDQTTTSKSIDTSRSGSYQRLLLFSTRSTPTSTTASNTSFYPFPVFPATNQSNMDQGDLIALFEKWTNEQKGISHKDSSNSKVAVSKEIDIKSVKRELSEEFYLLAFKVGIVFLSVLLLLFILGILILRRFISSRIPLLKP